MIVWEESPHQNQWPCFATKIHALTNSSALFLAVATVELAVPAVVGFAAVGSAAAEQKALTSEYLPASALVLGASSSLLGSYSKPIAAVAVVAVAAAGEATVPRKPEDSLVPSAPEVLPDPSEDLRLEGFDYLFPEHSPFHQALTVQIDRLTAGAATVRSAGDSGSVVASRGNR